MFFKCLVTVERVLGMSVCEVHTDIGIHTAIAPTHKDAFKAGLKFAALAFQQHESSQVRTASEGAKEKAMKQPVVSITVPFCLDGRHYKGLSLRNGVDFGLDLAPCGGDRAIITLGNAIDPPTGIFWDTASAVDDKSHVVPPGYLAIDPIVPPEVPVAE